MKEEAANLSISTSVKSTECQHQNNAACNLPQVPVWAPYAINSLIGGK